MSASLASLAKVFLANVGKSLQNCLANVGESGESRKSVFGECWQVLAKLFGKCRRVWRVREYASTRQSAHDKVCRFKHKKHILYA
jgi:hypothetical protein